MTTPPYGLEVTLDQPFRLARGQEARLAGSDLSLRKVAFTRRVPPSGFEDRGDEVQLTLEIRQDGEPRRKTMSWWDNDEQDTTLVFWALGDLEVHAERSGMLRVISVAQPATPPLPSSEPRRPPAPDHTDPAPDQRLPPTRAPLAPLPPANDESPEPGSAKAPNQARVRRRRKRRRRSWLRRVLGSMLSRNGSSSRTARTTPASPPPSARNHRRRRKRSKTRSGAEPERPLHPAKLRFEQKVGWRWYLRILQDDRTLGLMRGANPLALVATVEEYFVAFGGPRPGYTIVLTTARPRPRDRDGPTDRNRRPDPVRA